LITTIRKFPNEGRYVPRMTKKLQEVAGHYKGGDVQLAQLYLQLVPAMILYYKDDGSNYARSLQEQAAAFLAANNLTRQAAALKAGAERARLLSGRR
jgi:hypothetical protein